MVQAKGPVNVLCPFHREKTPSCRIWPNGHFYCYGCQEKGHVRATSLRAAYEDRFGPLDPIVVDPRQLTLPGVDG